MEPNYVFLETANNLFFGCQIVLIFCTEHDSITAVLCANCQNDLATQIDVLDETDFAIF